MNNCRQAVVQREHLVIDVYTLDDIVLRGGGRGDAENQQQTPANRKQSIAHH